MKEAPHEHPDFVLKIVQLSLREISEAEMDEAVGARQGERTSTRLGYRSGHDARNLVTRVSETELPVRRDQDGRFNTEVIEGHRRAENGPIAGLGQMYVQGVRTRKVEAITEQLRGYSFSATAVRRPRQQLGERLECFHGGYGGGVSISDPT